MAIIPKVRFKWREPKTFVKDRDSRERKAVIWWHRVLGVVIIAILVMPTWYLATLNPKKHPPAFEVVLPLAIFLGVFLVYIVPWIIWYCPSVIQLTDDALFVSRGNRHRSAMWKDVASFTFSERSGFQVLRLDLRKGGSLEVGYDSTVPVEDVRLFIQSVGVVADNSEAGPGKRGQ